MQTPAQNPTSFLFKGKTGDYKLPSGKVITLRETNGEDESVLSSVEDAISGANLLNFLSRVITGVNGKEVVHSPEELGGWLRNDIYYAMLCQRILTHGSNLELQDFCTNKDCKHHASKTKYPFTVDVPLEEYLLGSDLKHAVQPYKSVDEKIEAKLVDGLRIRFELETFSQYISNLKENTKLNKNTTILEHNTEVFAQDIFQPLTILSMLSAKQAAQIRVIISEHDPSFYPMAEYECPECETPLSSVIMQVPTFFYPDERVQQK